MTKGEIANAMRTYREYFERNNIPKQCMDDHRLMVATRDEALAHCHGTLDYMEEVLAAGKMEKFHRTLGFLQGVLWAHQIYALDDLKTHNRTS